MKKMTLATLFTFINISMAWSAVNPSHGTVICSGESDETYFTLSRQPRPDKKEMFILDRTTSGSNESAAMDISNINLSKDLLTFTFTDLGLPTGHIELEINLKTGKAFLKNFDDYPIELVCQSSAKPVDDIIEFIETNGLPDYTSTESEEFY